MFNANRANIVTSILWIVLCYAITRRPLYLHLALAPIYVATAIDLFLIWTFGARLTAGYVSLALTDYNETGEFVRAYARPVLAFTLLFALLYPASLFAVRQLHKPRFGKVAAIVGVLLVATYTTALVRGMSGASAKQSVLDLVGKEMGAPVGPVFQSGLAIYLLADTKVMAAQRAHHSFAASKPPSSDGELYVYVIGESSRPQNWSLFGYQRDTTPHLRATPGVLPLPNMLTTAPSTAFAVPSMMSLQPISDWKGIVSDSSIIKAFNETGFQTYWLSTQEVDSWGGIIPQVAAEAKHRRYFDRAFDGVMLDEVKSIFDGASPSAKMFVVIHTKGSHFEFSRRYPRQFARYASRDGGRKQQLIDTYDNSILYTDWFLSELIKMMAARGGRSTMVYASDHGENLLDDERQVFGHAVGTQFDLSSAAFVWLSEQERQLRPNVAELVVRHAAVGLSLSNLSHSLLDLAGIDARGRDLSASIFSPQFAPSRRSYVVRGELHSESGQPVAEH